MVVFDAEPRRDNQRDAKGFQITLIPISQHLRPLMSCITYGKLCSFLIAPDL